MPILTADIRLFQLNAVITMDHIWFVRNKLVHDNKQPNPIESIQIIANSVQIHKKAWSDSAFSSTWAPPLPGNFKANFDVAVKNDFSVRHNCCAFDTRFVKIDIIVVHLI
jgi:hypothetical protein